MLNNYRPTWLEINLKNLVYNYQYLSDKIGTKTAIPVVKANAYGHGSIEVVRSLMKIGVNVFAVSLLEEAIELRNEFKDIEILALGTVLPNQIELASKYNITITIYSYQFGLEILNSSTPIKTHLKVDTGMNRLGIKSRDEIISLVKSFNDHPQHQLEGIFTHFATADNNEKFFFHQLDRFKSLMSEINPKPKIVHLSNSSSMVKYENDIDFSSHTRLGISLYGLSLERNADYLKPVMKLKTKIVQFKELEPGEFVGYGITYKAVRHERIGIIPIGYADGLIRKNNPGYVEINGKTYPIIGRICMDYTFILVDENITYDDEVIVMGGSIVSIDEIANRLDTISYEIITLISKRVPRIYIGKED